MTAARKIMENESEGYLETTKTPDGVIYGPFANGPMGFNLGVNLLGTEKKVCSFNCPYCDLGQTELRLNQIKSLKDHAGFPSLEIADQAILQAFKKIHASGPIIDGISISGNGEPTLHPDFPELSKRILNARDLWMPGKPVHIFTNGSGLDHRKILDAVNTLDERIVKFDAGSEKLFKLINAPLSRTNLAKVITGTRKLKNVITQSLFFEGAVSNIQPSDIDDWIEVIAMIKPKGVHIYGLTRPAGIAGLVRCDQDTLYAIASRLERKTQIKATVIP